MNTRSAAQDESADAVERLLAEKVVAVVRSTDAAGLVSACGALAEGGIRAVEITLTVPGALEVLETVSDRLAPAVLIGAGTVLDAENARRAVDAGARFVVSPVMDLATRETCVSLGVPWIPGALTPTEVAQAAAAESPIVKLFPARLATPEYVRDLLGPFPDLQLMPTGGVDLDSAERYLRAGACAVGVGKALLDVEAAARGDYATITAAAKSFRQLVDSLAVR